MWTLSNIYRLEKTDFICIAELIIEVFKAESTATFYVPPSGKVLAKGKLFNSYNNYRLEIINKFYYRKKPYKYHFYSKWYYGISINLELKSYGTFNNKKFKFRSR